MTNQQGAPEALRTITRYEVVDCIDSKHVPAVIPNKDGPWVRYEDHIAALVEAQQPAPSAAAAQAKELNQLRTAIFAFHKLMERHGLHPGRTDDDLLQILDAHLQERGETAIGEVVVGEGPTGGAWNVIKWRENAPPITPGLKLYAAPQPSPTPQADSQPAPAAENLRALFREVLAWGMTYGPEIPAHQWDEMRESMVEQYVSRAARAPADSVTAPAGGLVAGMSETVQFSDKSKATPLEKALRYLKAMGDQRTNSAYFFYDGYPRLESAQDALATLAVLEQLAATPPAQAADSVLEDAARLDFKWNETQVKLAEVLATTPESPLFGQVSGRRGMTHWIVFMKAGGGTP